MAELTEPPALVPKDFYVVFKDHGSKAWSDVTGSKMLGDTDIMVLYFATHEVLLPMSNVLYVEIVG